MKKRSIHRWLDEVARSGDTKSCLAVLKELVNSLPDYFEHSKETAVRLIHDDQNIETQKFCNTKSKLQFPICDGNKVRGSLEVCYLQDFPLADEGPFREEEIEIVKTAARIAGFALERCRMFAERHQLKASAKGYAHTSGQVIAALRYQMRAPLNGILGFAEMLLEDQLTQEQRDAVNAIQSGADSVLDITDSILDYARLDADELELDKKEFSLSALVNGLTASIEKRTGRLIDIKSELPPKLSSVIGDSRRLREALESLVSYCASLDVENTTKANIYVEQTDDTLDLNMEVYGPHVIHSSLSEEQLFNPFEGKAEYDIPEKAALELAIARGLSRQMNGDLILDKVDDKVIFRLFARLPRPSAEENAGANHAPDASLKILVADDSKVIRVLASKILTGLGHQVDLAEDGAQALAKGAEDKHDLILMDLNMPNMSGFEATRALREKKIKTPIVSISSSALAEDRRQSLESGMSGFVTKPFKRNDLRAVLSEHCGVQSQADKKEEPLKVLIIDDDKVMRKLVRMVVKRTYPNAVVKTADDGLEACALLGSFLPRLVITDIIIPGVDGVAVVRFINERERYKNTAVVAMSSLGVDDDRVRTLRRLGAKQILPKPFEWNVFSQAVSAALNDDSLSADTLETEKPKIVPMPIPFDAGTTEVPIWDINKGLRSAGGCSSLLSSVVGVFLDDVRVRFDALVDGMEQEDLSCVQMQSHTLKGSSAAIGAERLSRVSMQIEMASREKDLEKIDGLIPILDSEITNLIKTLAANDTLASEAGN